MSLLDRLFAPPPRKKSPLEKLAAMVDAGHHMEAIIFAKEAHLGHDLALMLIERMEALPPAERVPLRAVVAAAFWDDERRMTPEQAIIAARFYLDREDALGAEGAIGEIFRSDESHVEGLYLRAMAMIRRNRFGDALYTLAKLLEIEPDHAAAKRAQASIAKLKTFHPPALVGDARPLLVAVGGDVGEIVRMTPLFRVIAQSVGHPIDVMITHEVRDDRWALVNRAGIIDRVFWLGKPAFEQRYERILLTESFGDLHPLFAADHVMSSAAWHRYRPGSGVDPTRHAIDVAADLLGFERPADVPAPYVGDLPETPEGAGSKRVALLPRTISQLGAREAPVDWPGVLNALRAKGLSPLVLGVGEVTPVEDAEVRASASLVALAGEMRTVAAVLTGAADAATLAHALGVPVVSLSADRIAPLRTDAAIEEMGGPDVSATGVADAVERVLR